MATKIIEQYINQNGSWVSYEPMIKQNGVFKSPENLWVKYNGNYIDNSWAVDFTVVEVEKRKFIFKPKIGDFVYGDKTWSTDLDSSKTCVGVITDVRSRDFDFIALSEVMTQFAWGNDFVNNVQSYNVSSEAIVDFKGKYNTGQIINQLGTSNAPAAAHCQSYSKAGFPAGSWYLPALGQWNLFNYNKTKINVALQVAGGKVVDEGFGHWSSTQAPQSSQMCWYYNGGNDVNTIFMANQRSGAFSVRAFCTYEYNPVPNGIYIYDKNNDYFTKEEWTAQNKVAVDAIGIGVVADDCQFVIALTESSTNLKWSINNTLISNIVTTTGGSIAKLDFKGEYNIEQIISQLGTGNAPAAEYCQNYTFPNGQKGYLGSLGEWQTAYNNKAEIDACISLIDGIVIATDYYHWTSTQFDSGDVWVMNWSNGSIIYDYKSSYHRCRPFTELPYKDDSGIYIQGTDNSLYTKEDWSNKPTSVNAVGVAVVDPNCQFVIAPTQNSDIQEWSKDGAQDNVSGVITTTNASIAKTDYEGIQNSAVIVAKYGNTTDYAASWCQNFSFPNGQKGYLGSCGEWQVVYNNKSKINACMSLIGGTAISTSDYHWTSTQYSSNNSWVLNWLNGNVSYSSKGNDKWVRAFTEVIKNRPISQAKVTTKNRIALTDNSGKASLRSRAYKDFSYSIEHTGYVPYTEVISSLSNNLEKEIVLEKGTDVNITVKENTESGSTISNAKVRIQSSDNTLDFYTSTTEGGMLAISLLNGTYNITIEKEGYSTLLTTIEVSESSKAFTLLLAKMYNVNVNVTRVSEPVEGAEVTVWGESQDSVISQILSEMGCVLFKRTGDKTGTFIRLDKDTRLKYFDGSVAKTDGTEGDVMVYMPEYYYHYENLGGTKFAYRFSRISLGEDWIHVPASLIGAYKAYVTDNKVYSRSGVAPSISISQANFITYSENRGTGFQIIDYWQHCQIAMLFYAKYKNRNSQAVLGVGSATRTTNTGSTDNIGNNDTQNTSSGWVNFQGIEGVFGGVYEWVKGVTINNHVWTITNPDGSSRNVNAGTSDGWITNVAAENGPFFDMVPTNVGGSETTHYSDYYYQSSDSSRVLARSSSSSSTHCGVAYAYAFNVSSYTSTNCGSRLAFRGTLTESTNVNEFKAL